MIIRKTEEKEKYLLKAFSDLTKEKSINWVKDEIEGQLKLFISYLKQNLRADQRIFESLESRIKGTDSFSEKIYRKGYLQSWEVTDNSKKNKELIARQLPDLIGFRITCFFLKDEAAIYNLLHTYYCSGAFENIEISFGENRLQKNGHTIYKVTGVYNGEFSFEIQIKSIMHNIWGEVEHKTIYKNRQFDPNIETKRDISEELFNILQASDRQLLTLFEETNTEEKSLQSLFFIKTKEQIAAKVKTDILAEHYERFFKIFNDESDRERIRDYAVSALRKKKYVRKTAGLYTAESFGEELVKEIEKNFYEYDLKALFHIASVIYPFKNYRKFLYYLANRQIAQCGSGDSDVDSQNDAFSDPEGECEHQDQTIKNIITLLTLKIGRSKNDTNKSER